MSEQQCSSSNKQPEPDDPFELRGIALDGDREVMIRCMIEEFARMGWTAKRIFQLFKVPNYRIPHAFYEERGVEETKQFIADVLEDHGVFEYDVEQSEDFTI